MKTSGTLLASALILLTTTAALHAQDAPGKPVAVRATVGDITDNRTTSSFNAECKIELKFTGDAAADAQSVRRVRVSRALDELGRDLVRKDENDTSSSSGSSGRNVLKANIELRNPSRNAAVIKVIEGEVEFFSPTEENGGILVIKDVLKQPGENVKNPTLAQHGVEVMYLTKAIYEAKKKQLEDEQKKNGGAALGAAFGDMFKGMFGGMMSSSSNSVNFYIKDPNKRVVDVELQDASGKALKRRGGWSSNEFRTIDLDAAPPADAQLRIHLATPQATASYPFKVENIPLP